MSNKTYNFPKLLDSAEKALNDPEKTRKGVDNISDRGEHRPMDSEHSRKVKSGRSAGPSEVLRGLGMDNNNARVDAFGDFLPISFGDLSFRGLEKLLQIQGGSSLRPLPLNHVV